MQSLRSMLITSPSSLLRIALPPCHASILSLLPVHRLEVFSSHRDDSFTRSLQKPVVSSCHLYAGCRKSIDRLFSCLSPVDIVPGFDIISSFRHLIGGSFTFIFLQLT